MKPTTSPRSPLGLTCRIVRVWSMVRREDATLLPHAESCTHCRLFFHSMDQLTSSLQQSAGKEKIEFSPTLENRIINAVRSSAREPQPRRHRALTFAFAGGAAAVVGVSIWSLTLRQAVGPKPGMTHDYAAEVSELVTAVQSLPGQLRSTLETPAVEVTENSPLQREARSVVSDARSALDFLALNFLPAGRSGESSVSVDSDQRT